MCAFMGHKLVLFIKNKKSRFILTLALSKFYYSRSFIPKIRNPHKINQKSLTNKKLSQNPLKAHSKPLIWIFRGGIHHEIQSK